jgi:hypothetical protein
MFCFSAVCWLHLLPLSHAVAHCRFDSVKTGGKVKNVTLSGVSNVLRLFVVVVGSAVGKWLVVMSCDMILT